MRPKMTKKQAKTYWQDQEIKKDKAGFISRKVWLIKMAYYLAKIRGGGTEVACGYLRLERTNENLAWVSRLSNGDGWWEAPINEKSMMRVLRKVEITPEMRKDFKKLRDTSGVKEWSQ